MIQLRQPCFWLRLCLIAILFAMGGCHTGAIRPASQAELVVREPNPQRANALAFRALSLVGTPYVYGGNSPQTGFDCSGFMQYIFGDAIGLGLRRTAAEQSAVGAKVWSTTQLRLGDLVFFAEAGRVFHVGMYVGEGRFVHAPRTGKQVELSALSLPYWRQRFVFARRMI